MIVTNYDDLPTNLTVKEAADVLRLSLNQMYYLIQSDSTIPVLRLGRKILVPKEELREWIKNRSIKK